MRLFIIQTKGEVYIMTFQEARDNNYTVFVESTMVAEQLKKKFKYRHIKSIHSRHLDGLRNVYIDKKINSSKIIEPLKTVPHVVYGEIPDI